MSKKEKVKKSDRSGKWNKQSQELKLDLKSPQGRNRFLVTSLIKLAWILAFALVVYMAILAIQMYQSWTVGPVILETEALPEVVVSGNSSIPDVLIKKIVNEMIEPDLATINPFDVKQALEKNGQIKSANVEKDFPDRLNINIVERLPVMMLAAMNTSNEVTFWAIDEEGIIYKPFDLQRMKSLELPFVEGLQIEEIQDGITRIEGIDKVHYLLQLLKKDVYVVYNDVRSVSLLQYNHGEAELGAVIILRGKQIKKLIFGVENFEYQIIKLIGVLSVAGKIELGEKNVVDLSYSGDAIVR